MPLFSVLKYIAFNAMVAVTITLATFYEIDIMITVSNWLFGIESAFYLLSVLLSGTDDFWKTMLKKPDTLAGWKVAVEPIWIVYMFQLGHVFNGVCMAFTALAYTYLVVCKYAKLKEIKQ